jgi:hypothetical protein
MIVALKLKKSTPPFMNTWVMGEATKSADCWLIKDTCTFYEAMNDKGQLLHNYVTDHMMTEKTIALGFDEVCMTRNVEEGDKVFEQYQKSLAGYKVERAGLVMPGPRPLAPAPSPGVN